MSRRTEVERTVGAMSRADREQYLLQRGWVCVDTAAGRLWAQPMRLSFAVREAVRADLEDAA